MGWMWSSQSPSAPKGSGSNAHSADESNNNSNKPAAPPSKQSESDYGDPEIAKFMSQLQAEFGSNNNNNNKSAASSSSSHPESETRRNPSSILPQTESTTSQSSSSSITSLFWSSPSPPEPTIPATLDPVTESLLPTSMSCRQAFDAAYHCNSLGGQWVSVYRSGEMRSCSEHWDDFWFCMRTRTYSPQQKEDAIKAHYRRKEFLKYHAPGRPSSTDVWQPREEKIPYDTAFRVPLDMPNVSDEEWRRLEIERRRKVQEQLQSRES